jgi:hypothetical protein
MIEPAFRAALMPQVGAAALPNPRAVTASEAAVALSAVAMEAEPEHGATRFRVANPLPKNNFAVILHSPSRAGLDNGKAFVSG